MSNPSKDQLNNALDEIWVAYDDDNSGTLELDEFKNFLKQTLDVLGVEGVDDVTANNLLEQFSNGKDHLTKEDMARLLAQLFG